MVLVGDIGVVACYCESGGAALGAVEVVGAEVDVVEFDVVFDVGSYWLLHGISICYREGWDLGGVTYVYM